MPKSKRSKIVDLSKVKKQGLERKKRLYEEIRSCADKFEHIFVFSVSDMRNSHLKNVREEWKDSRFFIGKNRVMAMALGRFLEEEYQPNLHKIGKMLKGECGLLFSSKPTDEVLSWFRSYSKGDYARCGNVATENVVLKEGPLPQFPHNLEPELRRLGLPTSLMKGIVNLVKDHEVCKVGDVLTPEAAKILEHLGYEMAEFHITILSVWSRDGSFMDLRPETPSKPKKKKKSSSKSLVTNGCLKEVEMEVDDVVNIVEDDAVKSGTENEVGKEDSANDNDEIGDESANDNDEIGDESANDNDEIGDEVESEDDADIELKIDVTSNISKSNIAVDGEEKENVDEERHDESIELNTSSNKIEILEKLSSTPKEISANISLEKVKESTLLVPKNLENLSEEEDSTNTRPSRPRKRKIAVKKELDLANSSQDSPVFRELRNRSVKVSKKRNK